MKHIARGLRRGTTWGSVRPCAVANTELPRAEQAAWGQEHHTQGSTNAILALSASYFSPLLAILYSFPLFSHSSSLPPFSLSVPLPQTCPKENCSVLPISQHGSIWRELLPRLSSASGYPLPGKQYMSPGACPDIPHILYAALSQSLPGQGSSGSIDCFQVSIAKVKLAAHQDDRCSGAEVLDLWIPHGLNMVQGVRVSNGEA